MTKHHTSLAFFKQYSLPGDESIALDTSGYRSGVYGVVIESKGKKELLTFMKY